MGIIRKQAAWNTVMNYIGIALGYLNVVILFPNIMSPEEFGITRAIIAISFIYMQLACLGTPRGMIKFSPFFNKGDSDNGFSFLFFSIMFFGTCVISLFFWIFQDLIIKIFAKNSEELSYFIVLCIPFGTISALCFFLESYLQTLFKTTLSTFMNVIGLRLIWAGELILFSKELISFDTFIWLYIAAYLINFAILTVQLLTTKKIKFSINRRYLRKKTLFLVFKYCLFSIFSGITQILLGRIDILMITSILTPADTGIYSIAIYFCSIVLVPLGSLSKITTPIIGHKLQVKDFESIKKLYKNASSLSFILGGMVFILILTNQRDLYSFLPEEYLIGMNLLLVLGMVKVMQLILGANNAIIALSKHYYFETISTVGLLVISVILNQLLIPSHGMIGAAYATLISMSLYTVVRLLYVKLKMEISPFSIDHLYGLLVLVLTYIIGNHLPLFNSAFINITYKTLICGGFFVIVCRYFPISKYLKDFLTQIHEKILSSIINQKS